MTDIVHPLLLAIRWGPLLSEKQQIESLRSGGVIRLWGNRNHVLNVELTTQYRVITSYYGGLGACTPYLVLSY
jgi:hypothetical protein